MRDGNMRYRLETIATWIGGAIALGGLALFAWDNPIATLIIVGVPTLGILILTARYDYDYWRLRYLRWRHGDILIMAAGIVTPHLDHLAHEWGKELKWDGRSDYLWEPWIMASRDYVDAHVIPKLSADQKRIVADWGLMLRAEIESELRGRVFERAKQLGLVI